MRGVERAGRMSNFHCMHFCNLSFVLCVLPIFKNKLTFFLIFYINLIIPCK